MLHRHALAWFAAIAGKGAARAFVTDEERVGEESGCVRRSAPQLRQIVDYDTLLEANPFGATIVVERDAYLAVGHALVTVSIAAARTSLLLVLPSSGTVGHIPLPLVALDAAEEGGVEAHAVAVLAHLAAHGLADRVRPGPPASWQSRVPERTLQVIIPTRDNGADLRAMIDSLRDHASARRGARPRRRQWQPIR